MKAEKTEWKGSRLKNVKKKSIYIKDKHETRETERGIKETQYYIQRKKIQKMSDVFVRMKKKSWSQKNNNE